MKRIWLISFILTLQIASLRGQNQSPEQAVQEIIDAYNRFEYQQAERKGLEALTHYQKFTPEQLVTIHQYLAFISFSRKNFQDATSHFQALLSIKPDWQLSPKIASPKIIDFFNEIKTNSANESPPTQFSRYLLIKDKRVEAGLRSALVPGWGQIHKNEKKKGAVLLSLWAANVSSLLFFQYKQNQAHQQYLNANLPAEIEKNYDRYNRYHKIRDGLILSAISLWLYSYVDALLTLPRLPESENIAIKMRFRQAEDYQLMIQLSFAGNLYPD